MELQKELRPIFRIYQSSGFAPFTIPFAGATKRGKWCIFSVILTTWLAALLINDIISYKRFFDTEKSMMISYLGFMIITVMRVVTLVIAIESMLQRKQQIYFLKQFGRMDRLFTEELGVSFDYKRIRRNAYIWMTIWILQLAILIGLILVDIVNDDISIWIKFWWMFITVPLFLPSTRYFQIVHYIGLLGFGFEMINTRLDVLLSRTNRLSTADKAKNLNKDDRIYDDIVTLRRIYHLLWESTVLLNKMFQWSLLLLIGASFFTIVVNYYRTLYWLLTPDPSKLDRIITYFIWSLIHTFHFITLSSICYNISQQVCIDEEINFWRTYLVLNNDRILLKYFWLDNFF